MGAPAILKLQIIADATKAMRAMGDLGAGADTAGKRTQTASQKLKGIGVTAGKVAGAAALGGLVMMLKTGVSEQSDYLKGQGQLQAGLKSTGNAAHTSVKQMEELASSVQNYSGQTDDSIVASEQLMLTFTGVQNAAGKNNDVFNQAIKMTADMAARMGGDASTYAVQLGKALNDPAKGVSKLTKIGVTFNDQQKKQIETMTKSGDTIGAQKIMLQELQKEFGGSAKAAGDTMPGQMARAKRGFEDASQSLAAGLLPAMTSLVGLLNDNLIPALTAIVSFIMSHKTAFTILATVIGVLAVAIKIATTAQRLFNITLMTNPIFWIIAAIVALVAVLVIAYMKVDWFRNAIQAAFNAIVIAVKAVASAFVTAWHWVVNIVTVVGAAIGRAVLAVVRVIWQVASTIFRIWTLPYRLAWDAVRMMVTSWIPATYRLFVSIVQGIGRALSTVARVIFGPFETAWKWISSRVIAPLARAFNGTAKAIGDALSGVFDAIIGPFKSAWHWIRDHVLSPIKSAWNGVANAINGIHFSLRVPSWVPKVGGKGFTFDPPNVPTLARGGLVNSPTLAVVGEAGPEIVAPDGVLRKIIRDELANRPSIIVNGALDPDAVARQIDSLLRRQARRRNGVVRVGAPVLP